MSQQDQIRAAQLLEEYLQAVVRGQHPSGATYLERCPSSQVERLRVAIEGLDWALEHYAYTGVNERTIQTTFEQIQEVQRKRQVLAQSRARAQQMEPMPSLDPGLYLAQILGVPSAALALQTAPPARLPEASLGPWDRVAGRSSSQNSLPESERQLQVLESEIARQTEQILERMRITTAPIDVQAVAAHFCLFVTEAALAEVDGCLVTHKDVGAILLNNQATNEQRRRFTLSHEIGHYVRHRHLRLQFRDTLGEWGSRLYDQEEFEADTFAAMLLLPAFLLPKNFGSEPPSLAQATALAQKFDVSLAAALRRMVRASHWRCALIILKDGSIENWTRSPGLNGYARKGQSPSPATMAAQLALSEEEEETAVTLPAGEWVSGPVAEEGVEVQEQSHRGSSGYIYSLITVIE